MVAVKEVLEKQWSEFCRYVREFAKKDSDTNDEEYNIGRYEILRRQRVDFSDPSVEYYCMCNNLKLSDISGGIDDVVFG